MTDSSIKTSLSLYTTSNVEEIPQDCIAYIKYTSFTDVYILSLDYTPNK